MELALRHSSAVVVAFSLPLRPRHAQLSVSSPLRSIKATAQQILNTGGVFDPAEAPPSRQGMEAAAAAAAETTGRRVIGFARAYSDGAFSAMISDVAIEETYRSKDVGKKLVAVLIETLRAQGIGSFAAMASKTSHDYLHLCGFRETYLRALRFSPAPDDGEVPEPGVLAAAATSPSRGHGVPAGADAQRAAEESVHHV